MLLQSSKAGAVPRRRSCSSTSSQAVAVNSPSSELLCYVSVLSARYNLMLLHSSNGAVPRLLQHQQPSRRRNLVVVVATADVSAPPARCDVTFAAGQQGRSSAYLAVAPAHGFVVVVFAIVAVAIDADARSPVCAHRQKRRCPMHTARDVWWLTAVRPAMLGSHMRRAAAARRARWRGAAAGARGRATASGGGGGRWGWMSLR